RSRGDGRNYVLWSAGEDPARRPNRSRPSRIADSGGLRREKFTDRAGRKSTAALGQRGVERRRFAGERGNQMTWAQQFPGSARVPAEVRRAWECFMTTRWNRKDLLGLRELSADENNLVLDTADAFKQVGTREIKKVPALRGKTLVNFFVEPSTRTRTSFELAAHRLSADVINISAATSSLSKGETLKDTARNLEALHADILVLRHSSAGAPQFLAQWLKSSVINAGDGAHEHPTQGLLDIYTIREKRGKIDNLNVAIVGDILFSRVARSN